MKKLVLASTSPYRKSLLEKFNLAFDCAKPDIDETPLANESAPELVKRLAFEKAHYVARSTPNTLVIGSDQVAVHQGKILGKPHTVENAVKQLKAFSGQQVDFLTGLCVFDSTNNTHQTIVEPFSVHFKPLTDKAIEQYVTAEMPLNCAGSFKCEGLGICLFEKLDGDDPNSLIGLPLIQLANLLSAFGLDVLSAQSQ
ncbi:Maf family protein [Colwellia sp. MEBiC06753]